jgi:hypothetical protein
MRAVSPCYGLSLPVETSQLQPSAPLVPWAFFCSVVAQNIESGTGLCLCILQLRTCQGNHGLKALTRSHSFSLKNAKQRQSNLHRVCGYGCRYAVGAQNC